MKHHEKYKPNFESLTTYFISSNPTASEHNKSSSQYHNNLSTTSHNTINSPINQTAHIQHRYDCHDHIGAHTINQYSQSYTQMKRFKDRDSSCITLTLRHKGETNLCGNKTVCVSLWNQKPQHLNVCMLVIVQFESALL